MAPKDIFLLEGDKGSVTDNLEREVLTPPSSIGGGRVSVGCEGRRLGWASELGGAGGPEGVAAPEEEKLDCEV